MNGEVKGGHFYPYDKEGMRELMAKFEGKRVTVEVKKYRKDRSLPQLKYYWSVIIRILSQELGYEENEVHELLKSLFLRRVVELRGKKYVIIRSTSSLSTDEFAQYLEKIKRWASIEAGIFLPEPNETRR